MAKREILISDSEHAPSGVPTNNSVDYSSLGNVTPPNIRFSDTYSFRIDRFGKISQKKHLTFVLTELSAELSPNFKRGRHKSLDFVRRELRSIMLELVLLKRYID